MKRRYHDTIILTVPSAVSAIIDDDDEVTMRAFLDILNDQARQTLADQYPRSTMIGVDWTFATTPEDASAWPLPHDCDNCRDGKYKAIASLTLDPDRIVAMGDMTCEEPVR